MPHITTTLACPVHPSPRVREVAELFGLSLETPTGETFSVEMPSLTEDWAIGAIVGPSGSGKSTIARACFGSAVLESQPWPVDASIIDGFGDAPLLRVIQTLTAVGLGSLPAWLRPHRVLSNGERFRADLARALLSGGDLVVCDEFTSVVDRPAAKAAATALAKAIRSGRLRRRFVAVTCHDDVLPWLEPDWVLDMAARQLVRGRLRRPAIALRVVCVRQRAWQHFARHHYLSGSLSRGATCYVALWDEQPVAFCAVIGMLGHRGHKRVTRLVTLPDYQGLGIGTRLLEWVCRQVRERDERISITTSHPGMRLYLAHSPRWRCTRRRRLPPGRAQVFRQAIVRDSAGRSVASFEFVA